MTLMEKIRKKLASVEKEVLVDIVKSVQSRNMKGAQGEWKDFMKTYDRMGDSVLNPKRRTPESMIAFLETFTEKRDLKFFEKKITYHLNRKAVEQLNESCTGVESSPQELASLTCKHPEYSTCYSFPTYDEDWVMTKIGKVSKAIKSTAMFSVDCEMVGCEDGQDALVQVCVVDQNLEVKLNALVKPDKPVADYRTRIHGISAKDLERATTSLADIQKSMKKLLSRGVILIGHSLENDLKALKVDHARVIDTSLIFKYPEGHTHKRPSLNHLCKVVLNYDLRETGASHDCLDDAQAAMKLVLAKLEHKFDGDIPLKSNEDSSDKSSANKSPADRISIHVEEAEEQNGKHKKRKLSDKIPAEGRSVQVEETEEQNKKQRKKESPYVWKRSIQVEESEEQNTKQRKKESSDKRPADEGSVHVEETKEQNKKQKRCSNKCDHIKEIRRLRKEVATTDSELIHTQKVYADLIKKNGLLF